MKTRALLLVAVLTAAVASGQSTRTKTATAVGLSAPEAQRSQQSPAARVVELKASDGTMLKATYFASAKAGPGVLLLHQSNRTRKAWDELAAQLAAIGINTLTLDLRGFGESGGKFLTSRRRLATWTLRFTT
jgi:alpha-beta hydrolase superfamily lysophospholipase